MHIRCKLNSTKRVSATRTYLDGLPHQIQPLPRRIASKIFIVSEGVRANPANLPWIRLCYDIGIHYTVPRLRHQLHVKVALRDNRNKQR